MPKQVKFAHLLLVFILLTGFFLRVYRIDTLLGFYFDQGRDASVIWDLIHKGKFFLIGPTTGIAGIFRGPYYYYLIAPFYWLGGGNPIWPSVFLSFTSIIAVLVGFKIAKKTHGVAAGIIFAIFSSVSFYMVNSARWLSNPTPMFLLSMTLVWGMLMVIDKKKIGWAIIAVVSGLSLFNFGSSGELFYFPAIVIFFIWQWKNRPDLKNFILSLFLFSLTFAPLVLFDLKHEHILLNNLTKTFAQEKSFTYPTEFLFENRNQFYLNLFPKFIFHSITKKEHFLLGSLIVSLLLLLPKFFKNKKIKIIILLLASPIIGLYFYQGNDTVLYEYYLTGYFLIFLLLASVILGEIWRYKLGKVFVLYFLFVFIKNNADPLNFILKNKSDGAESIAFINQKQAIDWVYTDANKGEFNVDVYVPPVIPHAYDYLFTWLGTTQYGYLPNASQTEIVYTIYEVDPPHPERLEAWLARQKGIGKVEKEEKFGGITVQKRIRI